MSIAEVYYTGIRMTIAEVAGSKGIVCDREWLS
jgi:hypothetical protein